MPTCCVPSCRSGYSSSSPQSDITYHKFPKEISRRDKWVRCIHRDFTPNESHRVCSLHFRDNDFKIASTDSNSRRKRTNPLQRRYLKPTAYPSVFPNQPSYLTFEPPSERSDSATSTARLEAEANRLAQQIANFERQDVIHSLEDIEQFCKNSTSVGNIFAVKNCNKLLSHTYHFFDSSLSIDICIVVDENLYFTASRKGHVISQNLLSCMHFKKQLIRYSDLENLFSYLNNHDFEDISNICKQLESYVEKNESLNESQRAKYSFLIEQLDLVEISPNRRRYSGCTLVSSLLWQSHSTACYQSILDSDLLTLPSVGTIRSLTAGFQHNDSTTRAYLKRRRVELSDMESNVLLIFDEVYVYQRPDYHNGRFYGLTSESNDPASTVLVFLIRSLSSSYSDVVAMIPLSSMTVEILKFSCRKVFDLISSCGFKIVAMCSDNHAVNRSFFSGLGDGVLRSSVAYPPNSENNIFLVLDPTHNLKNVYNNFQRSSLFIFPHEDTFLTAKFEHIRELFELEKDLPVRQAHKLTRDSLSPSNIQRASFKHCAAIFHESTVNALRYFVANGKHEWRGTQVFVEKIHNLICIVNVKTPFVGKHKRCDYREPIRSVDDLNLERLVEYCKFFELWQNSRKPGLSSPTFAALKLMCESLRRVSLHLLSECGFSYVLLGNVQSDVIEKRFGRYRQMSGSNYFISVRQLMESEKKLKIYNCLSSCNMSVSDLDFFRQTDDDFPKEVVLKDEMASMLNEVMSEPDHIHLEDNELNILMYVSGYIICSLSKRAIPLCCMNIFSIGSELPEIDYEQESQFLNMCNRGGLQRPSNHFFQFCCNFYRFYCTLKSRESSLSLLLSHHKPAHVLCSFFCADIRCECEEGHDVRPVFLAASRSLFNIFAKNFLLSFHKPGPTAPKVAKLRSTKL